jgi:glycosyltransferase involved in cell wall biosynthesis
LWLKFLVVIHKRWQAMSGTSPHIAFFVGSFGGGGIERVTAHLAHGFVKAGLKIDLVLNRCESPHLWRMPTATRIIDLKQPKLSMSLPRLVQYLRQERPLVLLAADHYLNELALLAGRISGVSTRIVVTEHNQLSQTSSNTNKLKARLAPLLARLLYPWADQIIAVSHGVANDLARTASLPSEQIQIIYNPVITPEMLASAQEAVEHPWFNSQDIPVLLGVGKLEAQKDFPSLIRAFAKVRQRRHCRLVILGWGPDRPQLEALIQDLGLQEEVDLPGYAKNPYAYMVRSAAFVLSSAWEGLPTVLIEAMALGTPVVSTDCKSGPSEILAGGKYGYLTPVGDSDALADAMLNVLDQPKPIDSAWLEQFGLESATQKYLHALGISGIQIVAAG